MVKSLNIKAICWIAAIAVITVAAELVFGSFPVAIFSFPINVLSLALWLTLLSIIYKQRQSSPIARFMLSQGAVWLSFTLMAAVSIFLGLERKPSSDSWPVIIAILFILSHLVLITMRGWRNTKGVRWRFTILHLGLILALGAGFWGAPDREQLRIAVDSRPNDEAYYTDGTPHILGHTLRLEDYDIEYSESGAPEHYEAIVAIDDTLATISVNHPYALTWSERIYLISLGQSPTGETYCILEIVSEPWQWLSTAGIVMLIIGAVMMFIGGPRRNVEPQKKSKI